MIAKGPATKVSAHKAPIAKARVRKSRTTQPATDHQPCSKPTASKATATKSPTANSPLAQRMLHDMQLAGLGERTQESYLRAVRQLAGHIHLSPDQITEDQLRSYFLYLKNQKAFAPGSLRIAYHGIRFFYSHTVLRNWDTLRNLRVPKQRSFRLCCRSSKYGNFSIPCGLFNTARS